MRQLNSRKELILNGRKKLRPKKWKEEWREEINNGSKEG